MTTLKEIEKAISQLPEDQLNRFREWFDEFDAKSWDKQLEADVKAGKLDRVADSALEQYKAGRCREM